MTNLDNLFISETTEWVEDTFPFAWALNEDEACFSRVICGGRRYVATREQGKALDNILSKSPKESHVYVIAAFFAGVESAK